MKLLQTGMAAVFIVGAMAGASHAQIITNTFSYQGRLTDNGVPANGSYDLQFQPFADPDGFVGLASPVTFDNQNIVAGLFQVNLNFGNIFTGSQVFVQVSVRPGASTGAYTVLTPRRSVLSSPYAQSVVPGSIVEAEGQTPLTLSTLTGANGLAVTSFNPGEEAAAIYAENVSPGGATIGILGVSFSNEDDAVGVYGTAEGTGANFGVRGVTTSTTLGAAGTYGRATEDTGVIYGVSGETRSGTAGAAGVYGLAGRENGAVYGVHGFTESNGNDTVGVFGEAESATGRMIGVLGRVASTTAGTVGVFGDNTAVTGASFGVRGRSNSASLGAAGVQGEASTGVGVRGTSANGTGVEAVGNSALPALVVRNSGGGNLIDATGATPGNVRFRVSNTGNVMADGTYTTPAADFAEWMPAGEAGLEPGDVLAIGPDGRLVRSTTANQINVAGVVSTKPAFLGGDGVHDEEDNKVQLAVVGIVPVKVISENGPISAGDLLVASSSAGRAMRAGKNPANGSVIGKALQEFKGDVGTISMLVVLQ